MHRLLVLGVFATAASGCSGRSFEWQEEVRLASGESFFIQRSGRIALQGEWATASYTRAISMRLELPEAYGSLVWEGDEWPISLDRVEGRWWVVIPVRGYDACEAYGFPPEGYAAFSFDGSRWVPSSIGPSLEELTANLGRPRLDEGRYERVSYTWSEKYRNEVAPRLAEGQELRLRRDDQSCIKIRPPHDLAREASVAAFARLAPVVRAAVVESVERDLPPIETTERDRLWGERRGSVRMRDCGGTVSDIEALSTWDARGTQRFEGYRIGFTAVGAGAARSAYLSLPPTMQSVTCDGDRALAVLRSNGGERLIIVEYSRDGAPVEAWSYQLSALADWLGKGWGMPINLTDNGDAFAVTLVDETVTTRVQLALPKAAAPISPPVPLVASQR